MLGAEMRFFAQSLKSVLATSSVQACCSFSSYIGVLCNYEPKEPRILESELASQKHCGKAMETQQQPVAIWLLGR